MYFRPGDGCIIRCEKCSAPPLFCTVSLRPTAACFCALKQRAKFPLYIPPLLAGRPIVLRQIKQRTAAIHGVKFCVFDLFCSRVHLTRAAHNAKFIPQQKAIQIHGERVWDDVLMLQTNQHSKRAVWKT